MAAAFARRPWASWDLYSGPHQISGTVSAAGVPASRPVFLFPRDHLQAVRATRSAEDGSYSFPLLKAGEWIVLGIDDQAQYRAFAVDRVKTQPGA
jgi:hypothetical protein